jgi:hypothetical protein
MQTKLTNDNFIQYAMKHYDNIHCATVEEFEEDLKRFLYLKKLFSRYRVNGELRERLILNHIIILYNMFGKATTNMLFFKIDEESWSPLITFLIYLEHMPEKLPQHGIALSDVELDKNVIDVLRDI